MTHLKQAVLFIIIGLIPFSHAYSDDDNVIEESGELLGQTYNPVQTAVPFLMIAPDSRASGMGDVGAATKPDAYSMHWNPAKYAFIEKDIGATLSASPWLKKLVNDMYLYYFTLYSKLDKMQTVAFSIRYFTLGDVEFTNDQGDFIKTHNPNEFALTGAYSRLFSDKFSGSMAFRFIRSDLTGGYSNSNIDSEAGISFAADIATYYENDIEIYEKKSILSFGMNISNIGTKISYTGQSDEFIPINLRFGGAMRMKLDQYNELGLAVDLNKLLVPTTPRYNDNREIIAGKDPEVSVPVGMFRSFYDAPGVIKDNGERSVFREEMQEIIYSVGVEYWYINQFAIRAGYFNEHQRKGNRKYFTAGTGLKLSAIGIDFSYLIPINQQNPLANTVRISLTLDIGAYSKG